VDAVDVRLEPEPAPEEREAIVAALADARRPRVDGGGGNPWWRAGLPDRDVPLPPPLGAS
jgi:hypothetical protein